MAARYRSDPRTHDLKQVAAVALIEAADRFEADRGTPFSAFAAATVTGKLKRYFRDNRWPLHTSRRLGELHLNIKEADVRLAQTRQRVDDVDVAEALGCSTTEVVEARRLGYEQQLLSLDAPVAPGAAEHGDPVALADTLSDGVDPTSTVDDHEALRAALRKLPDRQVRVVVLRFYGNLTQREIGERIGRSQMQVSRMLRTALDRLRATLDGADAPVAPNASGGAGVAARTCGQEQASGHRRCNASPHVHNVVPTPGHSTARASPFRRTGLLALNGVTGPARSRTWSPATRSTIPTLLKMEPLSRQPHDRASSMLGSIPVAIAEASPSRVSAMPTVRSPPLRITAPAARP
ncbi:sigma-70 family RNA polymerase sigma factor [Dactylosporangium aurantiacum]|uniref:sigma-70 family RNA polymerase sigma factor n=1 Tax=Dactylosporangium aurantiacum TaxID=35754 RepID=UPI001FE14909|nr:sigma-70 family RNA polymerase sigma factor [Dactylosporangium aurantiacum]